MIMYESVFVYEENSLQDESKLRVWGWHHLQLVRSPLLFIEEWSYMTNVPFPTTSAITHIWSVIFLSAENFPCIEIERV